jgi:hypothetical protein
MCYLLYNSRKSSPLVVLLTTIFHSAIGFISKLCYNPTSTKENHREAKKTIVYSN